jgi:hypothetical protein
VIKNWFTVIVPLDVEPGEGVGVEVGGVGVGDVGVGDVGVGDVGVGDGVNALVMVGIKNSNTTAIAAIPIATNTHLFIFINVLIAEKNINLSTVLSYAHQDCKTASL